MLKAIINWLMGQGLLYTSASIVSVILVLIGILIIMFVLMRIFRTLLVKWIARIVEHSDTSWDDALLESKVFNRTEMLIPGLVAYFSAEIFRGWELWIGRISIAYMLLIGLLIVNAILNVLVNIYRGFEVAKKRPIGGYVQVVKIVILLAGSIVIVSVLLDQSPWVFLGSLGAASALILLVFQDTIMGFVASIQLIANNMVEVGDWIEMPAYNTDGDVLEVTVHTVKVQNWDKTISMIPTRALVNNSFRNWRGMSDAGGRRIKRALNIDMSSIGFMDDLQLRHVREIKLLEGYMKRKSDEIKVHNQALSISSDDVVNGRHLTNIGTFRAYVFEYLKNHTQIRQDMTLIVRQLPPGEFGLPLELYAFSADTDWANYEGIQSDIFDHLLAVMPEFGLRIFQNPTGYDMRQMGKMLQ